MGKYSDLDQGLQDDGVDSGPPRFGQGPATAIEMNWYIVSHENGCCSVISIEEGEPQPNRDSQERRVWGPFQSHEGAIARRIGLIRSGQCKPY